MEIIEAALEKLGLNSKRFKLLFMVCLVVLPVSLLLYQNRSFNLFERLVKGKGLGVDNESPAQAPSGKVLDYTSQAAGNRLLGPEPQIGVALPPESHVKADTEIESKGEAQNLTVPFSGSRNESFGVKNDSNLPTDDSADKLLQGLLAPNFEESACLSRYQSYLYRKQSAYKPSPFLTSKLRKYEELHKRCGPHTRAYKRTIVKIVKSRYANVNTLCKYIIWMPVNGLGNRMLSIGATFLYAVLTDRVLLVEFGRDMLGLFCEPFPNSTWLLPPNFPYRTRIDHLETYENTLQKNPANDSTGALPSALFLDLQHHREDHKKLFHCDHSQDLLRKIPAVFLRSDQYFVPSLFMVPSFNPELTKMFPDKHTVLHHLGHYLFHPSNEAWGLITRFHLAYMSDADQRIGLQVRVFAAKKLPLQTITGQILSCTKKHNLVPQVTIKKRTPSWRNRTTTAILVASLYSEFADYLRNMYWTNPTANGERVGVYQPSHEGVQKFNDNDQNLKAWAEIYLLSLCDVLVTSGESTFGYVAQSLGGLRPWIMRKALDKKVPNPPCFRALSMEPCFHFPPKTDCNSKAEFDVSRVFHYIKPCQDFGSGVKLVEEDHVHD